MEPKAPVHLEAKLKTTRMVVPVVRSVSSLEPDEGDKPLVTLDHRPAQSDLFLRTMGDVCPFFKDQLTNKDATLYQQPFSEYVRNVLETFQLLYPTCKYDPTAIQILLAMYLSSQERVQCRTNKDKKGESCDGADPKYRADAVKRWQTRTIARAHLLAHEAGLKRHFAGQHRTVTKLTWLWALGSDALELFFKEFKHSTLMALDLLRAHGKDVAAAREAFEVGVIFYHSLTAARDGSTLHLHWSQTTEDFKPAEALGFVSERHFVKLYGSKTSRQSFTDETWKSLERLWNVLGDPDEENKLPTHPRFPDDGIDKAAALVQVEKDYLQYLPTFDHPGKDNRDRTACEAAVRARVKRTLSLYLPKLATAKWQNSLAISYKWKVKAAEKGKYKTIRICDLVTGSYHDAVFESTVGHAPVTLTDAKKVGLERFVRSCAKDGRRLIVLELTGEEASIDTSEGIRRQQRRAAVEATIEEVAKGILTDLRLPFAHKDPLDVDAVIDELCKAMASEFYRDQAFDLPLATSILTAKKAEDAVPQGWFPLKSEEIPYSSLFPLCAGGFGDARLLTVKQHYVRVEGTSGRSAHYMDWRNHKDWWLYDSFPIDTMRRPLFVSLSTQPLIPAPNTVYGRHVLYYTPKPWCVYTFGDANQPRRSMLLLLDTILHVYTRKDRSVGQDVAARVTAMNNLLRRLATLQRAEGGTPQEEWQRSFSGENVGYGQGEDVIECHIFGSIDLSKDAWGLALGVSDLAPTIYVVPKMFKEAQDKNSGQLMVFPNLTLLTYDPRSSPQKGACEIDLVQLQKVLAGAPHLG